MTKTKIVFRFRINTCYLTKMGFGTISYWSNATKSGDYRISLKAKM